LVKDSKATLDGFRKLQPIAYAKRPAEPGERSPTLESHLVQLMERLATARNDLPAVYVRGPRRGKHASIALSLMSASMLETRDPPRVAIARHYSERGAGAISFATPGWSDPVISEVEYALAVPETGLVHARHVTTWAFAEIALSL
jgi:hypothetical protein